MVFMGFLCAAFCSIDFLVLEILVIVYSSSIYQTQRGSRVFATLPEMTPKLDSFLSEFKSRLLFYDYLNKSESNRGRVIHFAMKTVPNADANPFIFFIDIMLPVCQCATVEYISAIIADFIMKIIG